jgi:hypothetical protein
MTLPEVPPIIEPQLNAGIKGSHTARTPQWEFFEIVGVVALGALYFRFAISIASGVWYGLTWQSYMGYRFAVGEMFFWGFSYGDNVGVLFILALISFLWWRVAQPPLHMSSALSAIGSDELNKLRNRALRMRRICGFARMLTVLGVLGTIGQGVSEVLLAYAPHWLYYVGQGGFEIAYLTIGICAFAVAGQLCHNCDHLIGELDGASHE